MVEWWHAIAEVPGSRGIFSRTAPPYGEERGSGGEVGFLPSNLKEEKVGYKEK